MVRQRVSRIVSRSLPWLGIPALLLLALWGGQGRPEAEWGSAPGWGRSRVVGVTAAPLDRPQPAPLAIGPAGQIYLLSFAPGPGGARPQVAALGRDAAPLWQRQFGEPQTSPQQPQLLWDGQGLRLFWLSEQRLYGATVGPAGEAADGPRLLSGAARVASYAAAGDGRGGVDVWYAGPPAAPGLYALPAGAAGGPLQIDAAGARPALARDAAGTLHALWYAAPPAGQPALWYAAWPAGAALGRPAAVAAIDVADAGLVLDGPWFGLDGAQGYAVWTRRVTSGRTAGSFYSQYVAFPLAAPAGATPIRSLGVPGGADLDYAADTWGGLMAGPRVALSAGSDASAAPTTCAALAAPAGELALACQAELRHRYRRTIGQASALYFQGGRLASYQMISFGTATAFAPAIAGDDSGRLYMSWLSLGDSGFDVHLASSAPDLSAALGRLGWRDIGRIAFEVVYGMLTGAIFTPFAALLWSIAPLAALAVTWPLRRGPPRIWSTLLSLGLAVAAYEASKWRLLADARDYVPFSAWLPPMPPWLGPPLQVGAPLACASLAVWVAWRFTYRRAAPSPLFFSLIFIGVDSLLTMAIYGGVFFGALYPFA